MLNENKVFGVALCRNGGFCAEMVIFCVAMAVHIVATQLAMASRNRLVIVRS